MKKYNQESQLLLFHTFNWNSFHRFHIVFYTSCYWLWLPICDQSLIHTANHQVYIFSLFSSLSSRVTALHLSLREKEKKGQNTMRGEVSWNNNKKVERTYTGVESVTLSYCSPRLSMFKCWMSHIYLSTTKRSSLEENIGGHLYSLNRNSKKAFD